MYAIRWTETRCIELIEAVESGALVRDLTASPSNTRGHMRKYPHLMARYEAACAANKRRGVMARSLRSRPQHRCAVHPRDRCGSSRDPAYTVHQSMLNRCLNPNDAAYRNYGARGVGVHPLLVCFRCFLGHVGPRPSAYHTLDRINPLGNYEPGNVRWSTDAEQAKTCNKRAGYERDLLRQQIHIYQLIYGTLEFSSEVA